jgi:hypothetical protein
VTTTTEPRQAGEPEVSHIVIEDDGARIDELRVRGVPQRIVVTPKARAPGLRDHHRRRLARPRRGANTSRGAAGKRVWRVLNF